MCRFVDKGRIFMTHPTKAIFGMLLKDSVKVSRGGSEEGLYSEKDVEAALERTELVDFHQTIDVDGIKVRTSHGAVRRRVSSAQES